jgi:O-antigen/teichoic acid export membrane protein
MLKEIAFFASSRLFSQVLGMVTAFLRPKLLAPEMFGIWSLFRLVVSFGAYLHLGSHAAMRYGIPKLEGDQREDEIERLKGAVFWGSMALNLIAASVFLALAVAMTDWSQPVRFGCAVSAILLLSMNWWDYCNDVCKGRGDFASVSKANYIAAIIQLLSVLALTWAFGIYGTLFALPVPMWFVIAYYRRQRSIGLGRGVHVGVFIAAIRIGFPIVLFDIIELLVRSADRLLISTYLSHEQLGLYSLAATLLGFLLNVPGASKEIMETRMMRESATIDHEHLFHRYGVLPVVRMAYFMPLVLGPTTLILPPAIHLFLPNYVASIPVIEILIPSAFFLGVSIPLRSILVARHWQLQACWLGVLALLFNIAVNMAFLISGYGIAGVALGTGLSFLVLAFGSLLFVHWKHGAPWSVFLQSMGKILVPFIFMCLLLWVVPRLTIGWFLHPWIILFAQVGILGAGALMQMSLARWYGWI